MTGRDLIDFATVWFSLPVEVRRNADLAIRISEETMLLPTKEQMESVDIIHVRRAISALVNFEFVCDELKDWVEYSLTTQRE